jgi:hypothetical protein
VELGEAVRGVPAFLCIQGVGRDQAITLAVERVGGEAAASPQCHPPAVIQLGVGEHIALVCDATAAGCVGRKAGTTTLRTGRAAGTAA